MKLNKKIIQNFIKEKNITVEEFCKLNRINITLFNKLMKSNSFAGKEIYLNTIIRIAQGANVSILDLLEK